MIKNLVLSGGGIKGIAHIGALYALNEKGLLHNIDTILGTSVGSIVALLYVIGFSMIELYNVLHEIELSNLVDIKLNNLGMFGLDKGKKIMKEIKKLMHSKGYDDKITFKELYEITKKHLIMTTVCVNNMLLCYIDHLNYENMPVLVGLRMSISIPYYFCPVKWNGSLYIDGACLNNYPIDYFINDIDKTIGIKLNDAAQNIDEIKTFDVYCIRIIKIMINGLLNNLNLGKTVEIEIKNINAVDFNINSTKKDELFLIGYDKMISYLRKLDITSIQE